VDAKLTYQFCKSVSGTLAVENLFNRTYATYGVASTSTAAYNLYPGDPRNYRASLSMTF
jgi:iron complex outermembrane receptor protein